MSFLRILSPIPPTLRKQPNSIEVKEPLPLGYAGFCHVDQEVCIGYTPGVFVAEFLGKYLMVIHKIVDESRYGRFSMWWEDAPEYLGYGGKVSFIAGRDREGPAGYFNFDILRYCEAIILRVAFLKEDGREHGRIRLSLLRFRDLAQQVNL